MLFIFMLCLCLFHFLFASCTVLLICLFFLILCSHRCCCCFQIFFLLLKGYELSGEIALKNNHYYYYYYNRLNLDSLYARRLIQQATMFYKIHYNLVDICPPSYIQHANHISSRTDHPLKYFNKNPLQINAYKYYFFPRSMNIWNHLSCSAVSHVIPSVDNFH